MRWRVAQACLWHLCLVVPNFSCEAAVQRLSPTSGSLCGGNRLSIYGTGFASEASANRVDIGGVECKVETVSDSKLVCQVPFRHDQVVTGKESATELVTVHANGEPMSMAKPLEFEFKAESARVIVDWGPATGQANDVLSFQGKDVLSGASVSLGGRECKVKHSEGEYLQCLPPPREAGISSIEVNFGPDRGFACPGPKASPLKFTYNLALQSALPNELGGDTEGPLDGGGQLTAGPCSPRSPPSGTLVIVGQGLGNSTVFKLCGGDAWCTREGPVSPDPAIYHDGDWSFQTVACRPGPLDPAKAPGGSRKCDLTAEAAEGMFVATLANAWNYGPPAAATLPPATTTQPTAITAATTTPGQVYIGGGAPAPAFFNPVAIAMSPATAPTAPAPQAVMPLLSAPAPLAAPAPVAPLPVPTQQPRSQGKKTLKRMATKVLSKAFEKISETLSASKVAPNKKVQQLPPPYPLSQEAFQVPAELPPPPPLPTVEELTPPPPPPPPPSGLQALQVAAPASGQASAHAEALLLDVEAALKAVPPVLRGTRRHL